jgi:hypothetical protein
MEEFETAVWPAFHDCASRISTCCCDEINIIISRGVRFILEVKMPTRLENDSRTSSSGRELTMRASVVSVFIERLT